MVVLVGFVIEVGVQVVVDLSKCMKHSAMASSMVSDDEHTVNDGAGTRNRYVWLVSSELCIVVVLIFYAMEKR